MENPNAVHQQPHIRDIIIDFRKLPYQYVAEDWLVGK